LISSTYFDRIPARATIDRHVVGQGLAIIDGCAACLTAVSFVELLKLRNSTWGGNCLLELCMVLRDILEDVDWPDTHDPAFEMQPVVWAMKLGLLSLTAGLTKGKVLADVLLKSEEQQMADNLEHLEYDDRKAELEHFAAELCALDKKPLASLQPGGNDC
jgi:hypothetical protein